MCDCFGGRTFLFLCNGHCNNKFYIVIKEGKSMPDYKQMYLTLLDNVEKTLNLLVQAQKNCEEIFINTDEAEE